MPSVKVITTVDCQVDNSEIAHELGRELESIIDRLLRQALPTARNAQHIQSGSISFKLEIFGRRINIEPKANAASDSR